MAIINLEGLDKAAVLAVLYNASRPLGMGFLQYDPKPMSLEEGAELLTHQTHFDYLKGRVMKLDLSEEPMETWGYDRDNGPGAAEAAVAYLRKTGEVSGGQIKAMYLRGFEDGIKHARTSVRRPTTFEMRGGLGILTLGCEDVAEELGEALDKAEEAKHQDSL